jgi:hypothetical protein
MKWSDHKSETIIQPESVHRLYSDKIGGNALVRPQPDLAHAGAGQNVISMRLAEFLPRDSPEKSPFATALLPAFDLIGHALSVLHRVGGVVADGNEDGEPERAKP